MNEKKGVTDIRSSLFGGLNKADVTEYIQKLQERIQELDQETEQLRQETESLKKRLNNAEVYYSALWNNCENLKQTIRYQDNLIEQMNERFSQKTEDENQ